jgi:hypothetical protein
VQERTRHSGFWCEEDIGDVNPSVPCRTVSASGVRGSLRGAPFPAPELCSERGMLCNKGDSDIETGRRGCCQPVAPVSGGGPDILS